MHKQIQKSVHERIAKIKLTRSKFPQKAPLQPGPGPTKKTPSLPGPSRTAVTDAVSLAGVDHFLFENFRSLYQTEYEARIAEKSETNSILLESPRIEFPPLENLCRSDRFFVSCGSSTSLITEEVSSSSSLSLSSSAVKTSSAASEEMPIPIPAAKKNDGDGDSSAPDDYLAIVTYSSDPYGDFRRSMQEMAEARLEHGGVVDWEFLEELLFCYLNLNHKKSYGCILRAFVDLVVDLRQSSFEIPADD